MDRGAVTTNGADGRVHGRASGGMRRPRGFTLIEVMIVILIVLMLGGLVAWNLMGTKEQAEADIVRIQMHSIQDGLKQFRFIFDRYPTDDEGLKALWDKTAISDEEEAKKWKPFLEKPIPKDKWSNEWGYRQKSEHGSEDMYDLWSYGKDRQEGTDDDIVSWDKEADAGSGSAPAGGSKGSSKGG
jgi:general secretion pathway protein G